MPAASNMNMREMAGMTMPMTSSWTAIDAFTAFAMWAVMMVAMMLPSASPMILMYARIARASGAPATRRICVFVFGYVAIWTMFSAAAALLQYFLQRASLLSTDLRIAPLVGGVVLALAGLYQLLPLKQVCLRHCHSPIGFLISKWRDGAMGAFTMGLEHGAFCVGCCWMLMALLFVMGVMNLFWVAIIAVFVLFEKIAPWSRAIAGTAGIALIASGIWIAALA
ncbi:MAG: DUF2182 domain-containing protein [Candidatus Binataceae bacterium]